MGFIYIAFTILFTVYGQLILKYRVSLKGEMPLIVSEKIYFIAKLLIDPWVLSGFFSAFIASLFWMAAMTKFDLSYAYPFMSLSFVLVFVLSIVLFHEPVNLFKLIGIIMIICGIVVASKGL